MATLPKSQYDPIADAYCSLENDLPSSKLESELVSKAIGDCRGRTVLDLGGGTGLYARTAISQGADLVHVVDNSPVMLEKGRVIEATRSSGQGKGKIQYFEGSASESLCDLPLLHEGYDLVMCNWVFNHAKGNKVRVLFRRLANVKCDLL